MLLITRALSFTAQHKREWRFTFNGDEYLCPRSLFVMTMLPVEFFLGDIRPMSEAQQHAVRAPHWEVHFVTIFPSAPSYVAIYCEVHCGLLCILGKISSKCFVIVC